MSVRVINTLLESKLPVTSPVFVSMHYLERTQRYYGEPEKAAAWHKNAIRLMETFGDGGEVPPAWLQKYFRSHFFCGTALCGAGKREDGYAYIEKVL